MQNIKFYSEEEAQKKLDDDFQKIVKLLQPYVTKALGKSLSESGFQKSDIDDIQKQLPDGWIFQSYSNAFTVRIGDGENEENPFFAPSIFVDFEYGKGVFDKKIIKRYPIGYCNCGNKIKPMLDLIELEKQLEKGGVAKIIAIIKGQFIHFKFNMKYPCWKFQLYFNQCEKCL